MHTLSFIREAEFISRLSGDEALDKEAVKNYVDLWIVEARCMFWTPFHVYFYEKNIDLEVIRMEKLMMDYSISYDCLSIKKDYPARNKLKNEIK